MADAAARRNPLRSPYWQGATEAGLRGGLLAFDDRTATIRLRGVRFVDDLTVSGEIRLSGADPSFRDATARLDVTDGGGSRAVRLSWEAFRATDETAVSGVFAGHRFTGTIPQH
ncbi:hypothetical protein AB0395_24985 [Streptosporangium sp. NPDC051023]|uniref:hypothetical protein n=1 Tax=Streptosporangium sp. NPDC051023 TaxID=3155410 RepID=UPI00344D3E8D